MEKEKKKILLEPLKHQGTRYNGGWMKTITKINKEFTNGYSLEGEFINGPTWIEPYTLILDCGKGGSRKHQEYFYKLFYIDELGREKIIYEMVVNQDKKDERKQWAVKLWEPIEDYMNTKKNLGIKCSCGEKAEFTIALNSHEEQGVICKKCLLENLPNLIDDLQELKAI